MAWDTRTVQKVGNVNLSERQQYLTPPTSDVYSNYQESRSSQNHSSRIREECMYPNVNSVIPKNYKGNCISQHQSITTSSDMPMNGILYSGSNKYQKNCNFGHLDKIPSIKPDSTKMLCYSSNARCSSAVQSQANSNVKLVPSHPYVIETGASSVGQMTLKQPHHSAVLSGVNLPNQSSSPANEMRFVWVPTNQNFNTPVSQGFTTAIPQQRESIQKVPSQPTFANTFLFTNVSISNSPNRYVSTQTVRQQNPQVSACTTTSALHQPISALLNSTQMVAAQNPANYANSVVPVEKGPSENLQIQSNTICPTPKMHELWPHKFVSNSTSQPVQRQSVINTNVQNRQKFVHDRPNDFFIGVHPPQNSTSETVSPTYNTTGGSNITLLTDHESLKPSNYDEMEYQIAPQTQVDLLQCIYRQGQEIQSSITVPTEQSKSSLNLIPLQGSRTVYNSEIKDCGQESVAQPVSAAASLTGKFVMTEEDMVREIKNVLKAKDDFLSLVQNLKEMRKIYKSSKRNKNGTNVEGSRVSLNLDQSQIATSSQSPSPRIAENLACPPPLTSDRLAYQHKVACQQGDCMDRVSSASIHGLYLPEKGHQGNLCSPASVTSAYLCPSYKDRVNSASFERHFPGGNSLQREQNNHFTASDTQSSERSEGLSDILVVDGVEVPEKFDPCTSSVVHSKRNDAYECATELQSKNQSPNSVPTESPLLTALLTEANQDYSKLTGTNKRFFSSLKGPNNVPPTKKDIELLSKETNLLSSNTNVVPLENVTNIPGSRLEEEKVVPPQTNCQVARDALESCLELWKTSSNIPAQNEQLTNTNIDDGKQVSVSELRDKNDRETLPARQQNQAVGKANEGHQGAVAGRKHDSFDSTVIKAVDTPVAIVNPLILSKSKSPFKDVTESPKIENDPAIHVGGPCSLREQKKQMVDVSTMADINVTVGENHPSRSKIDVPCKLLSDAPVECTSEHGKIVSLTGSSNFRSVNQNDVTVAKTQPQDLLEKFQTSKSQSDLSCGYGNHVTSKPQTSLVNKRTSPDRGDLKSDDCMDDSNSDQLKISSFCTLVEGNTFYDSQIAQMFDCSPSEENIVSGTSKERASGTLRNTLATDLVQKLLPGVQTNVDSWNKEKEPARKNDVDDHNSLTATDDHNSLTAIDDQINDGCLSSNAVTGKTDYFVSNEYNEEATPFTDDQLHEESECANLKYDQLSELLKEFPYGLERIEGTNSLDDNLVLERKDLDINVCTKEQESRLDDKIKINISSTGVSSSGKDDTADCAAKTYISKNKPVEIQFDKDCTISCTDSCDQQQDIIHPTIEQCESEVQKECMIDYPISSPEMCDPETEDSLGQIKITVLDSEQMIKLFPEMSATDANIKSTQPNNTEFQNGMQNKENLASLNSGEVSLVGSEADLNSSNEKPFCCLYRWLSSVYAGVPKCSCSLSNRKNCNRSRINSDIMNPKKVDDADTEKVKSNNMNKLSLCVKGERRNRSAFGVDVKRIKADGDTSPIKVQHKVAKRKLYQHLEKVTSEFKKPEQERSLEHHVTHSVSRETKGHTSKKALTKEETPQNCGIPEVDDTFKYIPEHFKRTPPKVKNGKLVIKTDFLKVKSSTAGGIQKVKVQEKNLNDINNEEKLVNLGTKNIEITKFPSNHSHNEKDTCNIEKSLYKRKVPRKKQFAAERMWRTVEPPSATSFEPCTPANKGKKNAGFPKNECKSKHMTDKRIKKLSTTVSPVNQETNDKSKTSVLAKDTKESSKIYLNRVAFRSTSTEKIHLTKLEFGFSPGKVGGEEKSQKVFEPTCVKDTEEPKMLEFKLCPEVLLSCNSTDQASAGDNLVIGKETNSVEGIRCQKEHWYKSIPLKKRKVDMAKFQNNDLHDLRTQQLNSTANNPCTPTARLPTPGSKAIFHAYKKLYLEKNKSLDSIPKKC